MSHINWAMLSPIGSRTTVVYVSLMTNTPQHRLRSIYSSIRVIIVIILVYYMLVYYILVY